MKATNLRATRAADKLCSSSKSPTPRSLCDLTHSSPEKLHSQHSVHLTDSECSSTGKAMSLGHWWKQSGSIYISSDCTTFGSNKSLTKIVRGRKTVRKIVRSNELLQGLALIKTHWVLSAFHSSRTVGTEPLEWYNWKGICCQCHYLEPDIFQGSQSAWCLEEEERLDGFNSLWV